MANKDGNSRKGWEESRVLITGISGFVGPRLAKALLARGAKVFGFTVRRADGRIPKNLRDLELQDVVHLIEGNLTDISSLAHALDVSKPDYVFHLAAQSYVARSFLNPIETAEFNCLGTNNLLEAVRMKGYTPVILFAGSSEEYGLAFVSEEQYERFCSAGKSVFPPPARIPELPITEMSPLRPMSPYAVSKVYGDLLMRNYFHSYGLRTVVSRAFNHEGPSRGIMFVTSEVTRQAVKLRLGEISCLSIGNVNAFRDWSHVDDIVEGYLILAQRGAFGEVYNLGSERTNSVASFLLLALESVGFKIHSLSTLSGGKQVEAPTQMSLQEQFGKRFDATVVDELLLTNKLEFVPEDEGLLVGTDSRDVEVRFDAQKLRPADVPILLSDFGKSRALGFTPRRSLKQIIEDQISYFLRSENR